MDLEKQIPLRLRFEIETLKPKQAIIENAQQLKEELKPDYQITVSTEHIWLYVGANNKKYYSPHLHLELEEMESSNAIKVKGLFGPDPVLWSFFMFLHFGIALVFIVSGVMGYSNWSLGNSFTLPLWIMGCMVAFWFTLYFIARNNRKKGIPQALELEKVMEQMLR